MYSAVVASKVFSPHQAHTVAGMFDQHIMPIDTENLFNFLAVEFMATADFACVHEEVLLIDNKFFY
jgi:hypothetical protein